MSDTYDWLAALNWGELFIDCLVVVILAVGVVGVVGICMLASLAFYTMFRLLLRVARGESVVESMFNFSFIIQAIDMRTTRKGENNDQ